MIRSLADNGYEFCSYENYPIDGPCVILRHDIDYSLEQALRMAKLENSLGVQSTFFVLLTSNFYNPASSCSYKILHEIISLGHHVGLHFDETAYNYAENKLEYYIRKETRILSDLLDVNINSFSLHRPNSITLETALSIPGLINSYGNEFFVKFKYLSDSRRNWREPVESIITSKQFSRLHILTHAFWYHTDDIALKESLLDFIESAKEERQHSLESNITNLDKILSEGI